MTTLHEAFAYLADLIALGIEFSTAHEHAVILYELTDAQGKRLMKLAQAE